MIKNNSNPLLLKIQSTYPEMTKAEKLVADKVIQSPAEVRFMPINELAASCGVSVSTVFRFCKTMDFDGFQDFRMHLTLSMQQDTLLQEDVLSAKIEQHDSLDVVAEKLKLSYVNAIDETITILDKNTLEEIVDIIMRSDQVRFFGIGASFLSAREALYKFLHIMPNVYCVEDVTTQIMAASIMNEDDVAIFLSHSGCSPEVLKMANLAKKAKARTIAITRFENSQLAKICEFTLLSGGYESPLQEGSFPAKTAQEFVLELLFTEVYRKKFDYSLKINRNVAESYL